MLLIMVFIINYYAEGVKKMTITIVGGDRLGNIPAQLEDNGFTRIHHLAGRKHKQTAVEKQLPDNSDIVLVLTDFVGTDLSRRVKKTAKKQGLPVLFARRSWACIHQALQETGYTKEQCSDCETCQFKNNKR